MTVYIFLFGKLCTMYVKKMHIQFIMYAFNQRVPTYIYKLYVLKSVLIIQTFSGRFPRQENPREIVE